MEKVVKVRGEKSKRTWAGEGVKKVVVCRENYSGVKELRGT